MSAQQQAFISSVVSKALSRGYQLTPAAVRLLQQYGKRTQKASVPELPNVEAIVMACMERKARPGVSDSDRVISEKDLGEAFPDLFELAMQGSDSVKVSHSNELRSTGDQAEGSHDNDSEVEILKDPSGKIEPVGMEGFSELFKSRYEKVVKILMERPEARQLVKVSKLNSEKGGAKVAGLVLSKRPMKNGVELTLDDDTGKVAVLALGDESKRLVDQVSLDQCVMLEVEAKHGKFLLRNVIHPDIPSRMASTSKKTVYAVFLSDLHIGSDKFLSGAFERFLGWLSGKNMKDENDEEILRRLKYVVIGGDVVDGVGVFPNQEYELAESNIYRQYEMVAERLKGIPEHLRVFVIPGNHDSARQALPQPMIPRKYAKSLYELPNVQMLGDPSLIKLHGVSILVYHGRSLDDVLATTPGLSYEKPTEAMKMLLKSRHLAPIFGSRTPIAPEREDHLVIEEVPDIFHAGHVHTVGIDFYKSSLMVNSGTWQAQTGYQANLGITPRPGLVPIVNLATLGVELREFLVSV